MWLAGFRAVDPVQADFDLLVFCVQHRDGVAVRDADAAGEKGKQEKYKSKKSASHRRKWEMENPPGGGRKIHLTDRGSGPKMNELRSAGARSEN